MHSPNGRFFGQGSSSSQSTDGVDFLFRCVISCVLFLSSYLEEYNQMSKAPMSLVMFRFAIEHISRVSRVLRQDDGHALLVGKRTCLKSVFVMLCFLDDIFRAISLQVRTRQERKISFKTNFATVLHVLTRLLSTKNMSISSCCITYAPLYVFILWLTISMVEKSWIRGKVIFDELPVFLLFLNKVLVAVGVRVHPRWPLSWRTMNFFKSSWRRATQKWSGARTWKRQVLTSAHPHQHTQDTELGLSALLWQHNRLFHQL